MGCTPSIHVSQTGVVYCRESDESNSPRASSMSAVQAASQIHGFTQTTVISGASLNRHSAAVVDRRATISITEAETQTASHSLITDSSCDVYLGPMHVKQRKLTVLLVFGKEDGQSDAFLLAAEQAGYDCSIVHNSETALESFLDKQHDVVIIDHRHHKYFDADALCRKDGDEEPSIKPLLHTGFTKRFVECAKTSTCLNELLTLEHSDVKLRRQTQAAGALITALDACSDAVDITTPDPHEFQYVNSAFERLFGYSAEEVIGKETTVIPASEKNKPEINDTIIAQLKKGKVWEGSLWARKKTGENIQHHCKVIPLLGHTGQVQHYITVRSTRDFDQIHDGVSYRSRNKGSLDLQSLSSNDDDVFLAELLAMGHSKDHGNNHFHGRRRESVTKIQSMTIEAPITKVINIINAAQQSSPVMVVQALDKVLEILRSSELYSPYIDQQVKNDQMISDLVGGLMYNEQTGSRRKSSLSDLQHRGAGSDSALSPSRYSKMPADIKAMLELEANWDFDILAFETVTKKRPLSYLAMRTFQRFGVMSLLRCSEQVMSSWLHVIESNYHAHNSYHNSTHAADVLQATAYFLSRDRIKEVFDDMDEVAALIAAAIHDVDHPGRTNTFLVNASSPLALLYNDLAVLESHHSSIAFRLTMKDPAVNIFKNLDRDDYRVLRQMIIDMVLATEMTKHFEHLSKFNGAITKVIKNDDDEIGTMLNRSNSSPTNADLSSAENKTLIKRILIKCADVSNPCRPLKLCKEWAVRISEEYFRQTDEEKQRGLPVVMPVFDRKKCNVPKSQTSFIELFINDMFDAWDCFCDIPDLLGHLQINYKYWKDREEAAAAELAARTAATEAKPGSSSS